MKATDAGKQEATGTIYSQNMTFPLETTLARSSNRGPLQRVAHLGVKVYSQIVWRLC